MTAAPLAPEHRAAAPAVSEGLRVILTGLATLIAAALLRHPRYATLILPLWNRLTRAARRFDRLMARVVAGSEQPRPHRPGRPGGRPPQRLPTQHAWLLAALQHHGGYYHIRLTALLDDPAAAAILAAVPQARSLLRPLCRMLGVTHPAIAIPPRTRRPPPTPPGGCPAPLAQGAPPQPAAGAAPTWLSARHPPVVPADDPDPCHHRRLWPFPFGRTVLPA